jgi:hypothetical protein
MGYGCWNASGLDPESEPKTLTVDYSYTSEEEFLALQENGEICKDDNFQSYSEDEHQDEFYFMSSTVIEAGTHLKKLGFKKLITYTQDERTNVYASYGDRYQHLHVAFELDKAMVCWQEEPFMAAGLCMVIAPCYHFESNHDVWNMDEAEFKKEYGLPIDLYKARAERQASALIDFMLSWMESEANAVTGQHISTGSGYMRNYARLAERLLPLPKAIWELSKLTLSFKDRQHLKPTDPVSRKRVGHPVVMAMI